MAAEGGDAIFLSVRLKVLLFAGISLAVITAAFTWLALDQLEERRQSVLAEHRDRAVELLGRLLQHQAARLQSLGTLVSDLPGVRGALVAAEKPGLARVFDPFWSDLNLNHGLDRVAFLSPKGEIVGDWGMADAGGRTGKLAGEASRREAPSHWLECKPRCLHITAVPLVERGRYAGTVILATGLQDPVMDYRRLSGAELAVLDKDGGGSPIGRIISVSGGVAYQELLRSLGPDEVREGVFQVERSDRHFRLYLFDAPVTDVDGVRFLAIDDVTAECREMAVAVRSSLLLGGLILVLALALLYLLLRPTMTRLYQAMNALPLLGEERYAEARAALPVSGRTGRHRDEIDDLGALTHALANTLEGLQTLSREHAASLQAQAAQLERERDFVAGLLDTAPVLILTYGRDDRIRLANANAVRTSGHQPGGLVGRFFPSVFMSGPQRDDHAALLDRMRMGDVLHSESSFQRPDGVERDVVWFHSCLDDPSGERTYLSVGLDVTDYRQVERSLMMRAEHDDVTGFYNRRAFIRELDAMLANGLRGALLLCDIGEFPIVNAGGDQDGDKGARVEFARHVETLRPGPALTARLGGDDFALVFPGLDSAEAIALARELNHWAACSTGGEAGHNRLSASVGIVSFDETAGSARKLLAEGQMALDQARAKGRDAWHLHAGDTAQPNAIPP
jgi:diguanylate cyclase (GGDEF)-like protein/PAS domain S-box-containing protein